jgi:hypothetical protein
VCHASVACVDIFVVDITTTSSEPLPTLCPMRSNYACVRVCVCTLFRYTDDVYDAMRRHNFALCENVSPDASTLHSDEVRE